MIIEGLHLKNLIPLQFQHHRNFIVQVEDESRINCRAEKRAFEARSW